ncbi:MAG: hypothetical protein ACO3RV_09640 [Luteolibacter sp.]
MKLSLFPVFVLLAGPLAAVPEIFDGFLKPSTPTPAEIGMVMPPPEIDRFVSKVEAAARQNAEWFRDFSAQAKPGVPLPYDERLGLTREEYDEYRALWDKREFKALENVTLILRETSGGTWTITAIGGAQVISTLRYRPEEDAFVSPNGILKRIEDINADRSSILGAWTGKEWKFEEETSLGKTKENFAIGRMTDGEHALLVYRVQELTAEGTRLLDQSYVLRFVPGKAVTNDSSGKSD